MATQAKRGRPAGKKTPKKPAIVEEKQKIYCSACNEEKKELEMFKSYNSFHKSGYLPYCKECFKSMCYDNKGKVNSELVKKALQLVDRPFLVEIYKKSLESDKEPIGMYMKNIAMPQYRDLSFMSSIFETNEISLNDSCYDGISEEVLNRWKGYSEEDVVALEEFYQSMKADNRIETVQDETYLRKLAVINLEQDKAGRRGEWTTYDKLGSMFSKFMADAKLRKSDQTEADRSGGLRNFGSIYSEVESDGWIPPWSHYSKINGANQDIVDKTIMHVLNFVLRTNKIERMTAPPHDTPKIEEEELDETAKTVNVSIDVEEDIVENILDGDC